MRAVPAAGEKTAKNPAGFRLPGPGEKARNLFSSVHDLI
jgi:hypothetical protein